MNYLFYVEGFSEFNFIKNYLNINSIPFCEDFNEIVKHGGNFVKNCKSDSNIFPSLKSDQWWIEELENCLIIIVSDTDSFPCFTKYKENTQSSLNEIQITKNYKIINSKPEIEQIYLEDIETLKEVIKGYHNQNSISPVATFQDLASSHLLTDNCEDRHVTKEILRKNNISMSKNTFSDKFFATIISKGASLSIIQRLDETMV